MDNLSIHSDADLAGALAAERTAVQGFCLRLMEVCLMEV
jgi:hypothetical protein